MKDEIIKRINYWKDNVKDIVLLNELNSLDEKSLEDSFYKDLTFGTGGLRGVLGVGTNKMNIYTIVKATQGLSNYLNLHYKNPSVVIGYDTRIKSDVFSKVASEVFAYNNIKVNIYKEPLPVPMVSFGTRFLNASCGVMITASHNPSKYNGYKVYGNDGCQITTKAAKEIQEEINKVDEFSVNRLENKECYIDNNVIDAYINEVKKQSYLYDESINKDTKIVYTPLNGTGIKPILRVLNELGYSNIITVKEQEKHDGIFPTCPYPNPEIHEALELGLKYAKENDADILIGTDPDSDRLGVAIKDKDDYKILTGNEVGILLFDYIVSQRIKHDDMPNNPVLVKTIVTTDLVEKYANNYNIKVINVLTGFKFIGEQIGLLEKDNRLNDYIFGFEESCGYLSGTYVRDKDGINAVCLVCEMFSYYKTNNIQICNKLKEIYDEYGYYENKTEFIDLPGTEGKKIMKDLMSKYRMNTNDKYKNKHIIKKIDYMNNVDNLPKSDVLKLFLDDGSTVVIRPSGTEPKIKIYESYIIKNKE